MALSPEIDIQEVPEIDKENLLALQTFRFDFETKRLTSELISGIEAIKQSILIALHIPRYMYSIYSSDTGTELHELMSDEDVTWAFKEAEIERMITEALIYDDRIERVHSFTVVQQEDSVFVSFTVETIAGSVQVEEVLVA